MGTSEDLFVSTLIIFIAGGCALSWKSFFKELQNISKEEIDYYKNRNSELYENIDNLHNKLRDANNLVKDLKVECKNKKDVTVNVMLGPNGLKELKKEDVRVITEIERDTVFVEKGDANDTNKTSEDSDEKGKEEKAEALVHETRK